MSGTGLKATFITPLTDVATSDVEGVGTLRLQGGKWYKYVKILNTTATVAGAAGDGVAYDAETGAQNNTVVIDLTDADAKPVPAGILTATVTGTAGTAYYGWIQIKGAATVSTALGGSAGDGDTIMLSTTDKTFTKFTNDDATETNDGHPCGVANDASAKYVVLDCPF